MRVPKMYEENKDILKFEGAMAPARTGHKDKGTG